MTNNEKILSEIRAFAEAAESGMLPEMLLQAARNPVLDPDGHLYELWCDNCGDCAEEGDDSCTDEAHLCCIRRFLEREYCAEE